MVGGAPLSVEYADETRADAFADNTFSAVRVAEELVADLARESPAALDKPRWEQGMQVTRSSASRVRSLTLAAAAVLIPGAAAAQNPIIVTTGADGGPGSLRAALSEVAKSEESVPIVIVTREDIGISSTLTYSGRAPLTLLGDGQTIWSNQNETLLVLSEGADLTVVDLDFRGPGDFDIEHRGDTSGQGGKGIFIDVRDEQEGIVSLVLEGVALSGVAYHGVHISDCDLADDCGGGAGGSGEGSAASIHVRLNEVEINDVGNGAFDADGVRIDERGPGDIQFTSYDSVFSDVGADGVELDEGQAGDVVATVVDSGFVDNGGYCDGNLLAPFLPEDDEAEFDDGDATPSDIPGEITGSPDDRCFEREVELYASGNVEAYEFGIDFDDGLDIDEAGVGDLRMTMVESEIRRNLDEGVDLDELDDGNAAVVFFETDAERNTDDGIRVSESGAGDGLALDVVATMNGANGIRMEEEDTGDLVVVVEGSRTVDNDDGDDTGLRMAKSGDGPGTLTVRDSEIADGIDARNVTVVEE
ncbi:MAG: hypothetical protein GY798_10835 [Hyphomicrobiales bacterium]|nr:hypothetical protein [Hyphomicrobiales bacterium]